MTTKKLPTNLRMAKLLKESRAQKDLTQEQVTKALGLKSPQYYSQFERGVNRVPPRLFFKLTRIYGLNLKALHAAYLVDEKARIQAIFSEAAKRSRA